MKKEYIIVVLFFVASISSIAQTSDEVVAMLHSIDDRSTRFNNRIVSISDEFNFGISGGINWLVGWEVTRGTLYFIYIVDIDAREIKFRHSLGVADRGWVHPLAGNFEILPGRTIGWLQIGDFNGEGFDMILNFHTGGGGPSIIITGFNPQTGSMDWVFFENFDDRYENSPIRFIKYRGMYGFMVREGDPPQVAGGPTWTPDPPNPRARRWFFYTWDREQFTFVEIGEVDETYIEGDWILWEDQVISSAYYNERIMTIGENITTFITAVETYNAERLLVSQIVEVVASVEPQANVVFQISNENSPMRFWVLSIIVVVAFMVVLSLGLVVVKKIRKL